MKEYFLAFLLMLQFLTRIPININLPCELENFKKGVSFLPVVGSIIGLIQFMTFSLLKILLPMDICAVLTVAVGVVITGAIHIDGFGDTCDGFFAFKTSDRIIEIMKDSRIGTYACIAIILDILIRVFSIKAIGELNLLHGILLAPIISRTLLAFLFSIGKTAKAKGTGNFFIGNCGKKEVIIAFLICLIITLPIIGVIKGIIIIAFLIMMVLLFNMYCKSKIGGLTGDTLGAANELMEILSLLIIIAMR